NGGIDAMSRSAQPTSEVWGPQALHDSRENKRRFQDSIAANRDQWIRTNDYFYDTLKSALRFVIEPGKRVLEVRCQTGHLLASVDPSEGVGVEIAESLVSVARQNYPDLHFLKAIPEELSLDQNFDYIVFSHIFDTVDILSALERVRDLCADGA